MMMCLLQCASGDFRRSAYCSYNLNIKLHSYFVHISALPSFLLKHESTALFLSYNFQQTFLSLKCESLNIKTDMKIVKIPRSIRW